MSFLPQNLSISIDRWLVPPKPKKPNTCWEGLKSKRPHWMSMAYMRNNMEFMIFYVLFVLVNLVRTLAGNFFCSACLPLTCTSWVRSTIKLFALSTLSLSLSFAAANKSQQH